MPTSTFLLSKPLSRARRGAMLTACATLLGLCTSTFAITLAEAERLALTRHPDVALGANAVSAAAADVTIAGQQPNPELSIQTSNIDLRRRVGGGNLAQKRIDTTAGVSWVWERGGKRDLRVATAEAARNAAQRDWDDLRRQQLLAVDTAYHDLKLAQERLQLLDDAVALQRRSQGVAEKRQQAGDLSAVDVARLQVELTRAEAELRSARAERLNAQRQLAATLGDATLAGGLTADDDYPPVATPMAPDDTLIDQRPDVQATQARLRAAEQARELAYAQAKRDVTVGVSAERYPTDNRGSLGVGFTVPLFWRHRFEGEQRRAETDVEAARLALTRQRLAAATELFQAHEQLAASADRLAALQERGLGAAERATRGVELAYDRGAAALTDVLDARRQLRALQLELAQARADHAKAQAAWRAVTAPLPVPAP